MNDLQRRAAEAKRLLDEPLLVAAFAAVEADAMERIVQAEGSDGDRIRRENADLIKALRSLRGRIEAHVLTGDQNARPRGGVA